MIIYTKRDGQQSGPYTIAKILAKLKDGSLSPSDLAWHENAPSWQPIRDCDFIQREIPPVATPAQVPQVIAVVAPALQSFQGPPVNCRHCGGRLKKEREATSTGSGCIIIILGLVLCPLLIGIPIVIYGLNLTGKCRGLWRCRKCHAEFPRKIRWYEFG